MNRGLLGVLMMLYEASAVLYEIYEVFEAFEAFSHLWSGTPGGAGGGKSPKKSRPMARWAGNWWDM